MSCLDRDVHQARGGFRPRHRPPICLQRAWLTAPTQIFFFKSLRNGGEQLDVALVPSFHLERPDVATTALEVNLIEFA